MGNILQDMMGLLSRKKVVKEAEPTDFILLGRTPNPDDSMFVTPKMNNQLITVKDLKAVFDEGEISGGGTVNTIAMFTPDGSTIGDSIITQDALGQGVIISGTLNITGNTTFLSTITAGGGTGTTGQVLSSTGTGVEWVDNTATGTVTGTGTTNTLPIWSDGPNSVLGDSQLKQSGPSLSGLYQIIMDNTDRFIINKPSSETSGDPEYLITQDGNYKVSMGWDDDGADYGYLYNWAGNGWRFGSAGNNPELTIVTTSGSEGVDIANNLGVNGDTTMFGDLTLEQGLKDGDFTYGTAGQVLSTTGSGQNVKWIDVAGGTGTVESITALSPLTGGTITETGSIGINQASTSADGYLSSTDWDTFNLKQSTSEKGQANGYAPLDSNNKVPTLHLPDSLVGAVVYQGTWDASINSPTLPTPDLSNKGHYYIVSNPGTYSGITYAIGDWAISNGSEWQKVDNTQDVISVFGRQGNVVANQSDYATFYADIDDAYSDAKVDLNLNIASATSTQVLSWSGTDYVWVDQQSGNPGTVTTVSASTAGDALDVSVANSSSTPDISLTWAGQGTQYIDGKGNLQTFPTIPTGTVTSVGQTHAGNAFTVTGSAITTSGVLAITLNGDATEYIDGAGDLQTFPSIPTLPANIVNTVTGGTNITTTNDTTTGDVIVNAPDAIVNTADTFGGPKVVNIVSLTSAQYPPAGGADANTLYIIL